MLCVTSSPRGSCGSPAPSPDRNTAVGTWPRRGPLRPHLVGQAVTRPKEGEEALALPSTRKLRPSSSRTMVSATCGRRGAPGWSPGSCGDCSGPAAGVIHGGRQDQRSDRQDARLKHLKDHVSAGGRSWPAARAGRSAGTGPSPPVSFLRPEVAMMQGVRGLGHLVVGRVHSTPGGYPVQSTHPAPSASGNAPSPGRSAAVAVLPSGHPTRRSRRPLASCSSSHAKRPEIHGRIPGRPLHEAPTLGPLNPPFREGPGGLSPSRTPEGTLPVFPTCYAIFIKNAGPPSLPPARWRPSGGPHEAGHAVAFQGEKRRGPFARGAARNTTPPSKPPATSGTGRGGRPRSRAGRVRRCQIPWPHGWPDQRLRPRAGRRRRVRRRSTGCRRHWKGRAAHLGRVAFQQVTGGLGQIVDAHGFVLGGQGHLVVVGEKTTVRLEPAPSRRLPGVPGRGGA